MNGMVKKRTNEQKETGKVIHYIILILYVCRMIIGCLVFLLLLLVLLFFLLYKNPFSMVRHNEFVSFIKITANLLYLFHTYYIRMRMNR